MTLLPRVDEFSCCGHGDCAAIASLCSAVDEPNDAVRACQQAAEAGVEGTCTTRHDECFETCGLALCDDIILACHDVDPGSGPIYDCHEAAHDGDYETCGERAEECIGLCRAEQDG